MVALFPVRPLDPSPQELLWPYAAREMGPGNFSVRLNSLLSAAVDSERLEDYLAPYVSILLTRSQETRNLQKQLGHLSWKKMILMRIVTM